MRRTADSVDALPPHRVLASSGELCLQSAAPGVVDDCESIQFVAGLAVEPGGRHLLLSYGVNDCSARVGHIGLERVLGMLRYADGRVGGAKLRKRRN